MIEGDLKIIQDTRRLEGTPLPQVSMIVPVYNVENYVTDCLLSIRANSVNTVLELIIIDDGSDDESVKVIKELIGTGFWPPILFLQQENRGLSAVRNSGMHLARGKYVGFLDSDDFILQGGLHCMVQYADNMNCDIVLGRSLIFDSQTQRVKPFYDQSLWDILLGGQSCRTIKAATCPTALSFEPNANYRLIRRQFMINHQLSFPEGLLFEDLPIHLRALIKADRIGLLDIPYYWYRVNRPGKITDEKSQRRFDVLKIAKLAINDLLSCTVTAEQGGAALRGLFRLVWGCGMMTLPEQRMAFFSRACQLFSVHIPRPWVEAYLAQNGQDLRHIVLGALMASDGAALLVNLSFGKRNVFSLGWFILRAHYTNATVKAGGAWLMHIPVIKARIAD